MKAFLLSALMEEKLKCTLVKTGVITMTGDLKYSMKENDAFLSEPLSKFKSGEVICLIGHSKFVQVQTIHSNHWHS